ncbi:MAG: DUF1028 domain-containing protein [Gaiellales bacterium]
MTFSIVACDIRAEEWGVAVASHSLAIGAVVPWVEAGAGAIATQAFANVQYGPHGLSLSRSGSTARETLNQLIAADPGRDERQAGVVDARGRSASHTGTSCLPWAGGRSGRGYAAQGDLLAGPAVIDAMGTSFEESDGRPLAGRLLDALRVGEAAGGDRRGRQSAAIRIARANGRGPGGFDNVPFDLRVDDHPDPIAELARLVALFERDAGSTPVAEHLPIEGALLVELRAMLTKVGHNSTEEPESVMTALRAWVAGENLGARWWGDPQLDPVVLQRLRDFANRG